MKDKVITMGQLLLESLTTDQIACMLEVIASAGDLKSLMDDFMRADPDRIIPIMPFGAKPCMS